MFGECLIGFCRRTGDMHSLCIELINYRQVQKMRGAVLSIQTGDHTLDGPISDFKILGVVSRAIAEA